MQTCFPEGFLPNLPTTQSGCEWEVQVGSGSAKGTVAVVKSTVMSVNERTLHFWRSFLGRDMQAEK